MSQEGPSDQPVVPTGERETPESKELTDKIHRLIRRFSRELVGLIYLEIGARRIKIKGKPGPKVGHRAVRGICRICNGNENARRKFGFICKSCSKGLDFTKQNKKRAKKTEIIPGIPKLRHDPVGAHFKIEVKVPDHIPVKPEEAQVEDAAAAFLDSIVEKVFPAEPEVKPKRSVSDETDFWS